MDVIEWFRIDDNPANFFPNLTMNNGRLFYSGQIEAFHDCLQRAKHTYEYVLFTDMDEIVIPTKYHRLVDFISWVHTAEMIKSDHSSIALSPHEHYMDRYNQSWNRQESMVSCIFSRKYLVFSPKIK